MVSIVRLKHILAYMQSEPDAVVGADQHAAGRVAAYRAQYGGED